MVPNFVDYRRSEHFWNKGNPSVQKWRTEEKMTKPVKVIDKIKPTLGRKLTKEYLKKVKIKRLKKK